MSWEKRRARLRRSWPGKILLWFFSLFYGAGVLARRLLYRLDLLKTQGLHAKVVCIGNLTTGGTGKTPAVLLAARTLRNHNQSVAILSRGYGRRRQQEATVLFNDPPPPWTECGDEPWMMHQALKGMSVPILVAPDRVKSGEQAVTFFHSRVIILDDGFQHHRLKRDLDIVLVNALDPFGGGHLLPLGDLREPVSALARAHMVLITHADDVKPAALEAIKARVRRANPGAPILEAAHRADFLLEVQSEKRLRLTHLSGKKVVSLSGLAQPAQFESQLARLGAEVTQRWRYPDHHSYTLRELRSIESLRHGLGLVTTFKDFTRFPPGWQESLSSEVLVLAIRLEILRGRNIWQERLAELATAA